MSDALTALTARVTALEDRQAIADLIARYGPAVDSVDGAGTAAIWADTGIYSIGGTVLDGGAAIAGLVDFPQHRAYVEAGCGHVLSPHAITLNGPTAEARGYSMVIARDGDTWTIARLSANRWQLRKGEAGWQVVARHGELLNGSEAARALLHWAAPNESET